MLFFTLLLSVAVAEMCSEEQSHYSDTRYYVKADGSQYEPEFIARPAWYRRLSVVKRETLNLSILDLMANRESSGCCFKEMSGSNAGAKSVRCLRPNYRARAPRVATPQEEPANVVVPGQDIEGWPRACSSGSLGLTQPKVLSVFGVGGGVSPVLVGKGTLVSRERLCNAITGCLPWKTASIPNESNMM